jgi:hypothetical protein
MSTSPTTPSPTPPTSPPSPGAAPHSCAACGTPSAGGRFCASCGAPLTGALCPACRSALTTGAKFCHRCGSAVGASPTADARAATTVPWTIAALALLALAALAAGRNFGAHRSVAEAPAAAAPAIADADQAGAGPAPPDISAMSPAERADRLFDRVMRLHEQGKDDSVQFFAPMVLAAFQAIPDPTLDQRYDLGRVGEAVGLNDLAKAEADTILGQDPTHLLGLALAARAATAAKQTDAAHGYYKRLLAAEPAERKKKLPEYERHQADIDTAIAQAHGQQT